ncbi:hypothetical protein [Natronococcus wangiae]|uniref:hypothetical protein n=1 Tax=Natronococcus wangiae TaxID=3068275 RepID=UPI00273F8965|nr:hypothetical protein [Natronococcus sp. AD5]
MSDRSTDPSAADSSASADDADGADDFEPGGGPQRVVSDESVDDILDSLNDSKSESSSSIATITSEPDEATETTAGDGTDDSPPATTAARAVDDSSGETPAADETNESTAAADDQDRDHTDEADSAAFVDDAAASLPDEAGEESLEELAARVEQGTVTGADVRAAEAGDGRDATPEIDEIDLGVDDLESPESTIGGETTSDAGPLAGSVDREDGADSSDDTTEAGDDDPGLLGRLVGLFSR